MKDSSALPEAVLDDRVAIVGTSGSGKTYAAKGGVERLLDHGARVCVVDPLGVWWGLRTSADGDRPGFSVIVFGGLHADVALTEHMGEALGKLVGSHDVRCVVDLSELGSAGARRRFMTHFAEAIYEANRGEPLHLILDEADLWAPQRPLPGSEILLGRMEEIVRRGRVRGFIPWLITQRPAVVHKDVLSQADVLIAMKLTSSQDRDAIGGWIEGQADKAEGKRILAELPRLTRGDGYLWAPSHDILERVTFPVIVTFDSSRTPKRGEQVKAPILRAKVDLAEIQAELARSAAPAEKPGKKAAAMPDPAAIEEAEKRGHDKGAAWAQQEIAQLRLKLANAQAAIHAAHAATTRYLDPNLPQPITTVEWPEKPAIDVQAAARTGEIDVKHQHSSTNGATRSGGAELRILRVLAGRHPVVLTMAQWATLSGMSRKGGTWNTYVSRLRTKGYLLEEAGFIGASSAGLDAVLPLDDQFTARSPATVRAMWRRALGGGVGKLIDVLAKHPHGITRIELAYRADMTPTGGTFNTYLSRLRSNDLATTEGGMVCLQKELLDG